MDWSSIFGEAEMAKTPELPQKALGWAATDSSGIFTPFPFSRRKAGVDDVKIKILYCGICHSDLRCAKNEWGLTNYPIVPGHEIVGVVTEIGKNVQKFKAGDKVGVGVVTGSCRTCCSCKEDLENYCPKRIIVFNSIDRDGTRTYGGFSDIIVVEQDYVLHFPENLPLDAGAPLLCAGISVYSSMQYYGMTESGKHLGVAGLGGVGHLAVKFGKSFGLKVTVISSSPEKEAEAINNLGADAFLVTSDLTQLNAAMGTMDFIIDTIPAVHDLTTLFGLLKTNGKLVNLGLPDRPIEISMFSLVFSKEMLTLRT